MKNQQLIGALAERKAVLRKLRESSCLIRRDSLIEWVKARHSRYHRRPGGLK